MTSLHVGAIEALPALANPASAASPGAPSFTEAMTAAVDGLANSVAHADNLAASVAAGNGGIAEAAIARAKADVMLEVAAVAASRVSGSITTLLQTQV